MSVWITSLCPISQARKSGVCFMTSVGSTWASFSNNNFTVLTWPERAAACRANKEAKGNSTLLNSCTLYYLSSTIQILRVLWFIFYFYRFLTSFLFICNTHALPFLLPSSSHGFIPFHPVGLPFILFSDTGSLNFFSFKEVREQKWQR